MSSTDLAPALGLFSNEAHNTEKLDGAAVDPITLEVIRHRLVSITNQIDANIKRTAFSPYIYEYNDFAVGLVGADGQLVAQCTGGMPPFVADSVGMAVRDGLVLAPETVAAIGRAEARRNRWTAAALWAIAGLLGWLVIRGW